MKILNRRPFTFPVHCNPGDKLIVTWCNVDGESVAIMEANIKEKQIFDMAVLVEYNPAEAESLGFKTALGTFAGESNEDTES